MDDNLQFPVPVVDPVWLEAHLDDPGVRILDTRGRIPAPGSEPDPMRPAYDDAHVPGAAFVAWNRDFVDVDDPVANQLAHPHRFTEAARRLGIDETTRIVCYDDTHAMFAARLWWAFRAMGHDTARVAVLDGGWSAWRAAGRPTSDTEPAHSAGTFTARPIEALRWSIEQVAGRAADVALVDARSRERFAGTGSDPVGGHIPGSTNAPYAELVDDSGFLRPVDELRRVLAAAGIDPEQPPATIVASCGSGISASVPLLALELVAPGVGVRGAVYDGSWSEWSTSDQPIERGAARTPPSSS